MNEAIFEEVLRQAEEATPRLSPVILGDQISWIIFELSAESFKMSMRPVVCDEQV